MQDIVGGIFRDKGGGQARSLGRLEECASASHIAVFADARRQYRRLIQFDEVIVVTVPKGLVREAVMGGVSAGKGSHDIGNRVSRRLGLSGRVVGAGRLQTGQKWGIGGVVQLRMTA